MLTAWQICAMGIWLSVMNNSRRLWLPKSLVQFTVQTLVRRKWQSILILLGVALGVAVMVSIDLANASASRAFDLSTEVITGKATHQIIPSGSGIRDELYARLRRSGTVDLAAPIVSTYVSIPNIKGQAYQLLGIDPFVDRVFRDYWVAESLGGQAFFDLLTRPGSVMVSLNLAERLGLKVGGELVIEAAGREQTVWIAGILEPKDRLAERSLDGILLADIATAQEISGKVGYLDRIDLILPEENPSIAKIIQSQLPPELRLETVEARQGSVRQMSEAFQLNLSALSLLALVVGLFLIYNTMTFSVVQRRDLFGAMRCLGVTRRELFFLVTGEALIIGVIGSGLGILLGVLLGRNTVGMVSQTINDLYFTTTVQAVGIPIESLIKGGMAGVLATLGAAIPPAIEAASIEPRLALSRSGLERKADSVIRVLAAGGILLTLSGYSVFQIPGNNLVFGFGGTLLVVVGIAMLSPLLMKFLLIGLRPLMEKVFGFLGKMAPGNLLNSISRTSVAVSALMVAVAVTIGVSLMIDSFRFTVTQWLEQTLQSDVYISVPGFNANSSLLPIDPSVIEQLEKRDDIERIDTLRATRVVSQVGEVNLSATFNPQIGAERIFREAIGGADQITLAMQQGGVIISEPLANRANLKVGDQMVFHTPKGDQSFEIAGIFYDYASSEGSVLMWQDVYLQWWQDDAVTAIGLRLKEGIDPDEAARQIQEKLQTNQNLLVRANASLRKDVMEVFDRTFAITAALRILATLVAVIGILSTLSLLQIEKQRETGILKALGVTGKELWRLVMLETGLMGLVAGLLAAPTGFVLAIILIEVINLRSFGWTILLFVNPLAFLLALVLALVAALVAGVLPAIKMNRLSAAEAIRYE